MSKRIQLIVLLVALVFMAGMITARLLQTYFLNYERMSTAYLAKVGNVEASYEAVTQFMSQEFPPGMTKEQVVAKLDRLFIYKFVGGSSRDGPARGTEYVAFPGAKCDLEDFFASPTKCRYSIGFAFYYSKSSLREVGPCDPPCGHW